MTLLCERNMLQEAKISRIIVPSTNLSKIILYQVKMRQTKLAVRSLHCHFFGLCLLPDAINLLP